MDAGHADSESARPLAELWAPALLAGYALRSMADDNDRARRAAARYTRSLSGVWLPILVLSL